VGLITPVTTRQLNVTKWRQVEIDDGFERVGCRVAMEALGDCCEPLGVLSLQREQCADGVTPTLRAAASIGGVARSGDRRVWCHLLARSIAGLAFGVAQRVITCRFTAPRHSFVLRYCNALQLIGIHQALPFRTPFLMEVAGGKLFLVPHVAPVGHSLLFAVGAWPPQDGVRRTRCLNLSRDLEASLPAGSGLSTRSPRPSSPQERRGSALVRRKLERQLRCDRGRCGLLAQRNSLPSTHMRCRITASLRATATRARAMPRRLAMFMPQARNADHLVLRISSEWAAS
jgi:hypothetical protein